MRVAKLIRELQKLDPHGELRVVLDVDVNLAKSDRNILDIGKVFSDHGDELNESFVYLDAIEFGKTTARGVEGLPIIDLIHEELDEIAETASPLADPKDVVETLRSRVLNRLPRSNYR